MAMAYDTNDIMNAIGEFDFDFDNKSRDSLSDELLDHMLQKFPRMSISEFKDAFVQYKQIIEGADSEQKH